MRKGLMAVLLVGASFAGGAAVNGLGNGWVRSLIQGRAPREVVAVSVDRDEGPPPAGDPSAIEPAPAAEEVPAAPPPSLVPDLPPVAPPQRPELPPLTPVEAVAPGPMPVPVVPALKPEPDPEAPAVPDPKAVRVEAPRDVPAPPPPSGFSAPATHPNQGWADAPGSAPAAAVLPRKAEGDGPPRRDPIVVPASSAPGAPEPDARPSGDWTALRRRMHELGVTRFWIEGEHDGPVRFRCVVPLAGARAVGQLFEAEGDDDLQAADAALRRVALWKATEAP